MSGKQLAQLLVTAVFAGLLAGCGGETTTPQTSEAVPAARTAGTYQPAATDLCEEVRSLVAETLNVETAEAVSEAPFNDYIANISGTGCQIGVSGTGDDFGNFVDVAQQLQASFAEANWADDMAYIADAPTGTAFAMRKAETLALFSVDWEPAEGVECPDDQPISACEIAPSQQIFTITVNVAEPSGTMVLVEPLAQEDCEAIQTALVDELGVAMEISQVDFQTGQGVYEGQACTLTATGTGVEFGNFLDVAAVMRSVLVAQGWEENQRYLADGPTGTAFGYEKDGQLAVGSVGWQPAEGVECPDDQPISACELTPEQQIFTIVLQLVQGTNPAE